MTQSEMTRAAGSLEAQPVLQAGARVGYAVSGVLHLLIGWIALQVAWSASGKSADQSGALQSLAGNSVGRLTLWLAVAGLAFGYILGCGIAYLIGEWNFHTTIFPVWRIVPQVAALNLIVAILAAGIPLRMLRRLEPATLLRGE